MAGLLSNVNMENCKGCLDNPQEIEMGVAVKTPIGVLLCL